VEVEILGKLLPYSDGLPALVGFEGSGLQYLPLFDTVAELEAFAEFCEDGFDWDEIKVVSSYEFLDLFEGTDVRPITNIRMVDGKVRYAQLPSLEMALQGGLN